MTHLRQTSASPCIFLGTLRAGAASMEVRARPTSSKKACLSRFSARREASGRAPAALCNCPEREIERRTGTLFSCLVLYKCRFIFHLTMCSVSVNHKEITENPIVVGGPI